MPNNIPWWAEQPVDRQRQEFLAVRDILRMAYPRPDDMLALARDAGMPTDGASNRQAPWDWVVETAVSERFLFQLYERIFRDPGSESFRSLLSTCLHGAPAALGAGLQSINAPELGLVDAAMHEQAVRDARRRTAMIEIGGSPRGTGFLVGPDLLLTAAHVIDATSTPPNPALRVVAVFDFSPGPRARAETGTRVDVVNGVHGSLPTQQERQNNASDWNAPEAFLDFALMRLARDVSVDTENGACRGFYELQTTPYDFEGASLLWIAQHPLAQTAMFSTVLKPFRVNEKRTRVRYTANTLSGSSGSAVVDGNGRLVALHHFAAPRENQGVVIHRIAECIKQKGIDLPRLSAQVAASVPQAAAAAAAAAPGPSPFEALSFGKEPFADREDLRNTLKRMMEVARNDRRILLLDGGEDTGKTFSYKFLTHLRARQEHPAVRQLARHGIRVARIDLDKYSNARPGDLVERIIGDISTALSLCAEARAEQPVRHITDLSARLERMRIEDGPVSWIFVDSLDRHELDVGDVRELLASLLEVVGGNESIPVRLVVSGRDLPQMVQELAPFADRETAEGLSRDAVQEWLTKSAQAHGRVLDAAELEAKLDELFPARSLPTARELAPRLPAALKELLGATP